MRRLAWLMLALAAALPARADYEAGLAAARAGDYAAALREWRPLAESGNRDAQFNLGLAYENGLGVAADAEQAERWYRRAADQEDRQAQAYLAEMYAKGLGVARDDVEALRWYRRAAEHGHAAAQYNVGLFYALGRGGVFGEGLGQGLPTISGRLPIPALETDFIFAAVAEELGDLPARTQVNISNENVTYEIVGLSVDDI